MRLSTAQVDTLDQLLNDIREAMPVGQAAVAAVTKAALTDPERVASAIRSRPKPWFFTADETMTVFCTEGRPGNASAPHDHGTWSVLGCFEGAEESWWYETDEATGVRQVNSGVLRSGDSHSLPADAIHSVMNRWNTPNGVLHIYAGNFLAADRHIWDPVTGERHVAGLSEPLAPSHVAFTRDQEPTTSADRPVLAGTAFVAVSVGELQSATKWLADAFGLRTLTTEADSCAVDQPFSYLIEPSSLTIVGLHKAEAVQAKAGLDHVALRVPSMTELEKWQQDLSIRGLNPSPITAWDFGSFVDVVGPAELTIRLFVPAVR